MENTKDICDTDLKQLGKFIKVDDQHLDTLAARNISVWVVRRMSTSTLEGGCPVRTNVYYNIRVSSFNVERAIKHIQGIYNNNAPTIIAEFEIDGVTM